MIRIGAVGDVHFDRESAGRLSAHWKLLSEAADVLLIAGDLTQVGHLDEAKVLAQELASCPVPVMVVLGNHDFHLDHQAEIEEMLKANSVIVLERKVAQISIRGMTLGVVGLKGFGGGFMGASGTDFGEPEMKAFIRHTKGHAQFMREALAGLTTDYRVALLHYAPIPATLTGERREIYPFLGSYLLGEAIDQGGADLVFHGHAHKGIERGETPGGIPVRNVAQPVIRHVFNVYTLAREGVASHSGLVPW